MHRHGYRGKKFGRETDQRKALIVGLASSLVISESIETTLPKAKETVRYTEKLITKAKNGGLHNRRIIISKLGSVEAGHKLVDEIAPKLGSRQSGHLSIKRTSLRRGDGAQLARITFVDDIKAKAKTPKPEALPAQAKPAAKPVAKPRAKKDAPAKKPSAKPKAAVKK